MAVAQVAAEPFDPEEARHLALQGPVQAAHPLAQGAQGRAGPVGDRARGIDGLLDAVRQPVVLRQVRRQGREARRLGPDDPSLQPGPIVLGGRVVGQHDGFARFTVGQRRGLPGGFGEPMFVLGIEPERRAVLIGPRQALLGKTVFATELNWLGEAPQPGDQVLAQVRHRSPAQPGTIVGISGDRLELAFGEAVSAISPGQSLVLYHEARVIGGGIIDRAPRALPVAAA